MFVVPLLLFVVPMLIFVAPMLIFVVPLLIDILIVHHTGIITTGKEKIVPICGHIHMLFGNLVCQCSFG